MIRKAGAIILKNKKILLVKPKNHNILLNPGGEYLIFESDYQCLRRELQEECKVTLTDYSYYKTFFEDRAALGNDSLELNMFFVKTEGTLTPSNEIESLIYVSKEDFYKNKYNLPSGLKKIIPQLVNDGFM